MSVTEFSIAKGIKPRDPSSPEAIAKPLSRLERCFLAAYLPGCDGTKAALACNRGGKNPHKWAHAVVKRPHVRAEIERRLAALESTQAASIEALREEYRRLAFKDYEGPWLASHKLQALDRLGNHLGMFKPDTAVQTNVSFSFVGSPRHKDEGAQAPEPMTLIGPDKPEPR